MADAQQSGPFWSLYQDLKSGRISRREFITRATALGVGLPVVLFILNSVKVSGAAAAPNAQDAAPLQSTRPTEGTDNQQRGAGGALKILQWQAATHLSVHVAQGTKDQLAAALITEPLMSYAQDGTLLPTLVSEVPSLENGGVSQDQTTVTYKLLPDVKWSDGQPFTADDVVFTWQWIMDPKNQSVDFTTYQPIANVEAVDPATVKITFSSPTQSWFVPFTSSYTGSVYPKHFWDGKDPQAANDEFRKAPIGTGPYVVDSFKENDQVTYKVNDNYREPTKPFFATVNIKGGGDAASAAQAVLQTGDWDFAWNLQVEPNILKQMEAAGKGKVITQPGASVERVLFNFADPDKEVNGERAEMNTPHPFLTDKAVRQALSLATDRDTIAVQFYDGPPGEPAAKNILTGIPKDESPNTSYEFNLDKANQTLDAAGWTKNGDVREKDGVQLKVQYFTTINSVRQKTQAVNKSNWEKAGFQVTLGQVDAGVFFDSAAGNDQSAAHFFRDLEMYTSSPSSPFPLLYMQNWYAGPDGANIAQKANGWSGVNYARYNNPQYDALYDQATTETDAEKVAQLFIQMNDIVINDFVVVPLVQRAAEKIAVLNTMRDGNISPNIWEALYWNIANWNRTS
ncbi:MAG TPA: peptide ABC transporter substrate-binding protein [Thermomicrobiales bacterium]|jgi:peptide/nickel transport system substrate-binding protein